MNYGDGARIAPDVTHGFRPKAFVTENVPGLVRLYGGRIRDRIIRGFRAMEYAVTYRVLLASDYGIPQDRNRVFLIGVSSGMYSFPEPTHFDLSNGQLVLEGGPKPKVTAGDAISDLPLLTDNLGSEEADYAQPPQNTYQEYCRKGSAKLFNHLATNHKPETRKIIHLVPEGGDYRNLPEQYRNTRRFHEAWSRIDSRKPAPTVDTGHRHHFHPWADRVPTVRECARFQSFPDTYRFFGSKTSQYRQVGNAVPPLLGRILGRNLKKCL